MSIKNVFNKSYSFTNFTNFMNLPTLLEQLNNAHTLQGLGTAYEASLGKK
jgi:hypothetical protein